MNRSRNGMGRGPARKPMGSIPIGSLYIQSAGERTERRPGAQANGIEGLKAKARDIKARLHSLEMRLREIEESRSGSTYRATVDGEKCAGCGLCQDICPTGAISVKEIARVNSRYCAGCGLCVQQCPQGALSLFSRGRNTVRSLMTKVPKR
jgi:ferredoxin